MQYEERDPYTILFKIITRMKLLFSNYLGDYSYSFQGSVEFALQLQSPCSFMQNAVTENNSPHEFSRICCNYSYRI